MEFFIENLVMRPVGAAATTTAGER
jgi:hypothetical protein